MFPSPPLAIFPPTQHFLCSPLLCIVFSAFLPIQFYACKNGLSKKCEGKCQTGGGNPPSLMNHQRGAPKRAFLSATKSIHPRRHIRPREFVCVFPWHSIPPSCPFPPFHNQIDAGNARPVPPVPPPPAWPVGNYDEKTGKEQKWKGMKNKLTFCHFFHYSILLANSNVAAKKSNSKLGHLRPPKKVLFLPLPPLSPLPLAGFNPILALRFVLCLRPTKQTARREKAHGGRGRMDYQPRGGEGKRGGKKKRVEEEGQSPSSSQPIFAAQKGIPGKARWSA